MHSPIVSRRLRPVLATTVVLVLALILASPASSFPREADTPWSWPTRRPVAVLTPFDPPDQPWLAGHRGVDLDVPVGTEILSPADGRVVYAGNLAGRPVISVDHGGIRSTYEPVEPAVEAGNNVSRGQVIGILIGGHSPGGLHWGAKISRTHYVDPLRLLVRPTVLKPWDGR